MIFLVRDYQPKKSKYVLPKPVYHQAIWIARDYNRWVEELQEIDKKDTDVNSYIKSNVPGNPIETMYLKKESYLDNINKMEQAVETIPEEYRKGVWNNVVNYKAFPLDADRTTYSRYKSKLIKEIAERFDLL